MPTEPFKKNPKQILIVSKENGTKRESRKTKKFVIVVKINIENGIF